MRSRKTILNVFTGTSGNVEESPPNIDKPDEGMELIVIAKGGGGVGEYNHKEKWGLQHEAANVGDPKVAQLEIMIITKVLMELQAIQSQGPKKYCILGTRHFSFLHQQIVEMLWVFICIRREPFLYVFPFNIISVFQLTNKENELQNHGPQWSVCVQ